MALETQQRKSTRVKTKSWTQLSAQSNMVDWVPRSRAWNFVVGGFFPLSLFRSSRSFGKALCCHPSSTLTLNERQQSCVFQNATSGHIYQVDIWFLQIPCLVLSAKNICNHSLTYTRKGNRLKMKITPFSECSLLLLLFIIILKKRIFVFESCWSLSENVSYFLYKMNEVAEHGWAKHNLKHDIKKKEIAVDCVSCCVNYSMYFYFVTSRACDFNLRSRTSRGFSGVATGAVNTVCLSLLLHINWKVSSF